MSTQDDILTVRLPRWAWDAIVDGIESWAWRSQDDIQILTAAEVEEP